jgi:3-phosphoshikimate 1-carboxyvinyltransferase
MERVAEPLRRMGGKVSDTNGSLPLTIEGSPLEGIEYELPVASAQVKSAILLAGLGARGRTTVVEPTPTRDHTELMLEAAGVRVRRKGRAISVEGADRLQLDEVLVPGDISSAAPFLVGAALLPGSSLTVHDIGLNPRRAGILEVLERMGVRVAVTSRRRIAGELVGDVEVIGTHELVATRVTPEEVPTLVDELPLVAVLGAFAHGETVVSGAEELRAKESDRIETVTAALRAIGVRIEPRRDGFVVRGTPARPRGGTVDAAGDHRIAMLGAVAGAVSREGVKLEGAESVAISFPGFFELLDSASQ